MLSPFIYIAFSCATLLQFRLANVYVILLFLDTAAVYGNETHIKSALNTLLPKYGLEREDIFITTKLCKLKKSNLEFHCVIVLLLFRDQYLIMFMYFLAPSDHGGRDATSVAYRKSLENLGLDYVDLYLIHFPGSSKVPAYSPRNVKLRDMTWEGLTELYDEGLVNSIGVSNFTTKHLQELMLSNHGVVPAVNQVCKIMSK